MKSLKYIGLSLAIALGLGFGGCGESSGDDSSITVSPTNPYNSISGTGLETNPYYIGAGEYKVNTGEYFKFNVVEDNCRVIVYPMSNLHLTVIDEVLQVLYDDSASNVFTQNNKLLLLDKGDYYIKTRKTGNKYADDIGTFGISSECTNISTYSIKSIPIGISEMSILDGFYKIDMPEAGTVLVRGDNIAMFEFYDSNLNSLGYTYDDEYIITLDKGTNYLFAWTNMDDIPKIYFEYL